MAIYEPRRDPGTDTALMALRRDQPCQHLDLILDIWPLDWEKTNFCSKFWLFGLCYFIRAALANYSSSSSKQNKNQKQTSKLLSLFAFLSLRFTKIG